MALSPTNMPVKTPVEVARGSRNASRKSPSKLPKVTEAMVNPASSMGPHSSVPSTTRTTPQNNVIQRENRRKRLGLPPPGIDGPRNSGKSARLEAARELGEPLALDMATAKIAAMTKPRNPGGIAVTIKSGKTQS